MAFDASGQSSPTLLEVTGGSAQPAGGSDPAAVGILSAPLHDARRVRAGLERAGIGMADIQAATPLRLFDGDTAANSSARVTALDDLACVIAAPGGTMSAHGGAPPTDLIAYVHRHDPASSDRRAPAADAAG